MAVRKIAKPSSASVTRAVTRQRDIQQKTDARGQAEPARKATARFRQQGRPAAAPKPAEKKPAVQTGKVRQPEPPLPAQHLAKPGNEFEMRPKPRFMAESYRGSGKLEGMSAIVTGGDSGIGRAVAVLFAREGADVAVLFLNEHRDAAETCAAVEREGRRCITISGDLKDPAFCESAVRQTMEEFGRLDILVNNAAFQEHSDSLEGIDDEHLQETLQVNIGGYFRMARAALPHLRAGSCIINSGSETGLFGNAKLLDYAATKGAIHAFTKSLASNLLERGIRVNAVAPGPVWTPLNPADKSAEDVADFGKSSDMGRPAQPEEISPAYVFLASPVCSSYVNGIVLPVMGGPRG